MPTKEEIEQAKDTLKNCIADYVIGSFCTNKDCMDRDMCKDKDCPYETAIDTVIEYIDQLETRIKDLEQIEGEHKKINADLMKKLSMEAMLKDLKRSKLYERSTKEK